MTERNASADTISGVVKWFDPGKGFGFVVPDVGGDDILLHANVLRNYGQSSVADGSRIELTSQRTDRGVQAIAVHTISPPDADSAPPLAEIPGEDTGFSLDEVPFDPARVKWFDKSKGFGFANVFGRDEDVFVHVEVLRRSGLADLQPGEAVAVRVVDGNRGRMAAQVAAWDTILRT